MQVLATRGRDGCALTLPFSRGLRGGLLELRPMPLTRCSSGAGPMERQGSCVPGTCGPTHCAEASVYGHHHEHGESGDPGSPCMFRSPFSASEYAHTLHVQHWPYTGHIYINRMLRAIVGRAAVATLYTNGTMCTACCTSYGNWHAPTQAPRLGEPKPAQVCHKPTLASPCYADPRSTPPTLLPWRLLPSGEALTAGLSPSVTNVV